MLQFVAIANQGNRREGGQLERARFLLFIPGQEMRDGLRVLFDGAWGMIMFL